MIAPFCRACLAGALLLGAACASKVEEPATASTVAVPAVPYGANTPASGTFSHDSVTLYYETYGEGQPLLSVHGNGASIGTLAAQIAFFKEHYKVIAMDSRDHGRSSDSDEPITYDRMTDDLIALLDHLELDSVDGVGWSDGGIEALLLGIHHPDRVRKIVAMAPNLNPGTQAIYPATDTLVKAMLVALPVSAQRTPESASNTWSRCTITS